MVVFCICVGERLGKSQFGANKLTRGYKDHATTEDQAPPVGHVVFVVHGIGQNLDISSIEKNACEYVDCLWFCCCFLCTNI